MDSVIFVALGGALGGMARFWLAGIVARGMGERFPWGTFGVNASGAFLIGGIAGQAIGGGSFAEPAAWDFAVVGFLGSYTTVSSFSLQTLTLFREGGGLRAGANILISLASCLGAVALGFTFGAGA